MSRQASQEGSLEPDVGAETCFLEESVSRGSHRDSSFTSLTLAVVNKGTWLLQGCKGRVRHSPPLHTGEHRVDHVHKSV